MPSAVDNKVAYKDLKQPGSRLVYISSSAGNDTTGRIYFWNGSAIVDETGSASNSAGVAYGTDPMTPSVAVRPYKRWSYVGPRGNAYSDIGSKGTAGEVIPATRAGFPDWWLFKRGDTFDLAEDLLSFARESNPDVTSVNGSLAVPGGRSATERQIVGAYGDVCQARPRFVHPMLGFLSRFHSTAAMAFKNVAYLSLHFDGNDRLPVGTKMGLNLYGLPAESTNILFEDIWIDGVPSSIQKSSASVTIRRSIITDAFDPSGAHVQGLYYWGNRDSALRIEESIVMRNGFKLNPKTGTWPPTGERIWSIFSRNLYLSGEARNLDSHFIDSVSLMGASGEQFRPGMRVERNFFYQGYVGMAAAGGYDTADGATGTFKDNVLQKFVGTGTNDNRGQPGWGFYLLGGAYGVDVTTNVITGAQHAGDQFAIELNGVDWDCKVRNAAFATRSNRVSGNILDSGNAAGAVRVKDGLSSDTCAALYVFPGVKGNSVSDNVMVNKSGTQLQYTALGAAIGTATDTAFTNNRMYGSRAAAAAALGWKDPERTLKTYLLSKGVNVVSADGYPEYFERATAMRRGKWHPDFTARPIVNYIRDGFSMPATK